jgi:hypothetical protein
VGEWVRAKACSTNACIEVEAVPPLPDFPGQSTLVLIRDRSVQGNTWLQTTPDSWRVFVEGIKNGDFDEVLQ